MRTGLKTLTKKIVNLTKHPVFLYSKIPTDKFPNTPIPKFQIKARFFGVKNEIKKGNIKYNLGSLYTLPHPITIKAYQTFLKYNPNHLGNWSIKEPKYGTEQLEYEVIQKMIDLYHATKENLEGHITSGGTEGNIYSLWLGRSYLEKLCSKNTICLLKTSLTHYSIRKAGNICNIPQFLTPLNLEKWNMDSIDLNKKIMDLYTEGYRGFLLPLTIGYTSTGTKDNIPEITNTIKKIRRKFKDIYFYIWIDAAINGLIEPFINPAFQPFKSNFVQSFIVDFHKFGLTPYPSGIVLYRKHLRKLIEKPIEYLQEKDNTLLGSRMGTSSVSIWSIIHLMGKKGYKHTILKQLKIKNYFIKNMKELFPKVEIITDKNSLSCGLIFHFFNNQRLPKKVEEKYWLFPGLSNFVFNHEKQKKCTIYKIFFLPHIKKKTINLFFSDLKGKA